MNSGSITARHFSSHQTVAIEWADGTIQSIKRVSDAPENLWVAPALVDLQINGYAGIDFQQDNLTVEQLLQAANALRAAGCTRFLLTLITDEWSRLLDRLKYIKALRDSSFELRHAIAGWHIEGPFLSTEPGYCGAHNPKVMCDPTIEHVRQLRACTGTDPVLLTLAPERQGAIAAIAEAARLGIKVSLGHTNATRDKLVEAIQAGATGFTHLGNALPNDLNRFDNLIWRVFETSGLLVSLIPDTIHVSADLFRIAHRLLGADSVYYTTDAMAAAGAPPGRYRLGSLELEVGVDRIVRQPGKQNFAGSALTPIEGVFRAAEMLRVPWQEVWPRFSATPARLLGLQSGLNVGQPADLCLLKFAGSKFDSLQAIGDNAERRE